MRRRALAACVVSLSILAFAGGARAFDLEDYAGTFRATRDAYEKAVNEFQLAKRAYDLDRAKAVDLGIDPADSTLNIPTSLITGSCENTQFGGLGKAYGDLFKFAGTALSPTTSALIDREFGEDFLGSYRAYRSRAVTEFSSSQPPPTVIGTPADCDAEQQGLALERLQISRDALIRAANEMAAATPPFFAARSAYTFAANAYVRSINALTTLFSAMGI